jgi:alkylated DNA repair dioxygenase AlkB
MKSIVNDAEIFLVGNFLNESESDQLFNILNDDTKFSYYNLYHYDQKKSAIVTTNNHIKSYWFGDYGQAVQTFGKVVVDQYTNEQVKILTDVVKAYPFHQKIAELKDKIEKNFNVEFNSCLVGKFDSPTDKIGFHSDASDSMGDDPYIASISFGKSRNFFLKKQKKYLKDGENAKKLEVMLNHGTLLIMRKDANKKYLHAVPPDLLCNKENCRINLTFRNYQFHEDEKKFPCSL